MDILSKLFGSAARVKLMRLFLLNPDLVLDKGTLARRVNVLAAAAGRELRLLERAGFLRRKTTIMETKSQGSKKTVWKRSAGWSLNQHFVYLNSVRTLLISAVIVKDEDLLRRLSRGGNIKLVLTAGIFVNNPESRVDLLVVGDRLKRKILDAAIRSLEAEIGVELKYTIMETAEFQYRLSICDKLIRDIIEYPHRSVLDKLGVHLFAPHLSLPRPV